MVLMGSDFTYQSAEHWFINMDKLIKHLNSHVSTVRVLCNGAAIVFMFIGPEVSSFVQCAASLRPRDARVLFDARVLHLRKALGALDGVAAQVGRLPPIRQVKINGHV